MANIPGMMGTWHPYGLHNYFFITSDNKLDVSLGWFGHIPGWG